MLPKRANVDGCFAKTIINVYDIHTKEIVFTGGVVEVAKFLGMRWENVGPYLRKKTIRKKQYALRHAPVKNESK